jgi:hypothetical protein
VEEVILQVDGQQGCARQVPGTQITHFIPPEVQ